MNTCRSKKRNGEPCTLPATQGSAWCWNHDPNRAEERSRNASRAANAKHSSVAQDMRAVVWNIVKLMMEGRLNTKASYNMNRIIQLLQTFLRAAEIELASGKEPERGNVLPPGMLEKLQQYIANEDGEEIETQVRLSEMVPPAEGLITGGELPEQVAKDWQRRLQEEIDQELRPQPSG